MYRVLIIDDEPIIRKGLANIINWSLLGCEICGEASDGKSGLAMIEKLNPQIVLTDIRMPEVDGLKMIQDAQVLIPRAKIIILTGHRDFNYAQDAIKLGVFDYVLKPSKIEELTAIIKRAVRELDIEKEKSAENGIFKELYEKNIPILREKLIYNLVHGLYAEGRDIEAQMERLDLKLEGFVMGIVENDEKGEKGEKDSYQMQLYQFGIISSLEEALANHCSVLTTALDSEHVLFLLRESNACRLDMEVLNEKLSNLKDMVINCFNFSVSIAISSRGESYKDLASKLRECKKALEHKFYLGCNAIIHASDLNTFFKVKDHSALTHYQNQLMTAINSGNRALVEQTVQMIRSNTVNLEPDDKAFVKSFYFGILSEINSIRHALSSDMHDKSGKTALSNMYKLIEECDHIDSLSDILLEASKKAADNINSYNKKNMKLLLRKAVDYLHAHYNEQVTLSEVADHLYVSPYYLSRMFKKELNQNFVDYLNEIRIEKAKELLKDIRYKTYEVADLIGIGDPHYFSKLFKKYVGLTPTEFKES